MIEFLTNFTHFLGRFFWRKALILLVAFTFSCSDEGCIEADDFGEYETQTLEVQASAAEGACNYDPTKPPDDIDQGASLKKCLLTGKVSVTDENGNEYVNTADNGCMGFDEDKRILCGYYCSSKCQMNPAVASSTYVSSEPSWASTSKKVSGRNSGVTIWPGAQIMIRAAGNITLGDNIAFPDMYVRARDMMPNASAADSWSNKTSFDLAQGSGLIVQFSGKWSDGNNLLSTSVTDLNSPTILNAARRLVAYITPHPPGYSYVKSATYEESIRGSLLEPDPRVWQCSYSGGEKRQAECANMVCNTNPYLNIGYSQVNCQTTNDNFPITVTDESLLVNVGTYGGMIRAAGDGTKGFANTDADPFLGVSCNNSNVCGTPNDTQRGFFVRDISNGSSPPINNDSQTDSYKVSFKSLRTDNSCDMDIVVHVMDRAKDDAVYRFETGVAAKEGTTDSGSVAINNSSWSARYVSLEPGQAIVVKQPLDGSRLNCGPSIAVRFDKFRDIKMNKSGFVNFTTLNGTSGSCTIKARIINKSKGSHADNAGDVAYTRDFYEYDSFDTPTASRDPLDNLRVDSSPSSLSQIWTRDVFVRKGQYIRFAPESWNGEFSTNAGSRECGIGMAMRIKPRPALLCRFKGADLVTNPACNTEYVTSSTDSSGVSSRGCKADDSVCKNPIKDIDQAKDGSALYCPDTACRPDFSSCSYSTTNVSGGVQTRKTCTAPLATSDPFNVAAKFGTGGSCIKAATTATATPSSGGAPPTVTGSSTPSITLSTCQACADAMYEQTRQPDKIPVDGMDICYDLENYGGKVDNIVPNFDLSDADKAKGLKRLGGFNGQYGNFEQFSDSGNLEKNTTNKILSARQPILAASAGVVRFMVVDGADFLTLNNAYSDNSDDVKYNGNDGMVVQMKGMLDYSDGQWLEVRLCDANSEDDDSNCRVASIAGGSLTDGPTKVDGQPDIIDIKNSKRAPETLNKDPEYDVANYKFDGYGNLFRAVDPGLAGDCKDGKIVTERGSQFYCHTKGLKNDGTSDGAVVKKLRLSFKIADPEVLNCDIPGTPGTAIDGVKKGNPNYNSKVGTNKDQTCPTQDITNCEAEFVCADKYANNDGKYLVKIRVKSPEATKLSGIVSDVVNPVVEVMDGAVVTKADGTRVRQGGQAERMYKKLVADPRYKMILNVSLVLMFSFYGFGYLIGVSELNHSELLNRIIKIGAIYFFTSETGWNKFNDIVVGFFKDGTDYLAFTMASVFDDSSNLSSAIKNQEFFDKSVLFGSADNVFNLFFSEAVQKKISALLFASLFGFIYLAIVYYGFILYIYAIANAVLIYLTAQVFVSLLFTLGPLFFIFTLFNQTKDMFDNWLKQLISFSLQQIFLLVTLAFFNMMMYEVIKLALGYRVCWDDVWIINLYVTRITLLQFWSIASLPPRLNAQSDVGNIGNPDGIPSLFSVLFILVIASLMNKFVSFMSDVAASIGGGVSATTLGSGIKDAVNSARGTVGSYAGKAWRSTGGMAIKRADKFFFDSGELAKQERKNLKAQDKTDAANKKALTNAADKDISKYKRENGAKLAGMSQEQQKAELTKVRDESMKKQADKMGISEADLKRLKSDSGVKYRGHSILGYVAAATTQSVSGGRTVSTSMADKEVKTQFSNSEMKSSVKNAASPEDRKKIQEGVESGKLQVDKKLKSKVSDAAVGAFKASAVGGFVSSAAKADEARREGRTGDMVRHGAAAAAEVLGLGMAARGVKMAVGAVKQAGGALKEKVASPEYTRATKELEAIGAINKMAAGTNWARSSGEKRLIRERVRANREQTQTTVKPNDGRVLKGVKEEVASADKAEAAPKKFMGRVARAAERMAVGVEDAINSDSRREQSQTTAGFRQQVQEEKSSVIAEKKALSAAVEQTGKKLSEMTGPTGDKAIKDFHEADQNLKAARREVASKGAAATPEDKKKVAEAQKSYVAAETEAKKSDKFAEYQDTRKKHSVNLHNRNSQEANLAAREKTLESKDKAAMISENKGGDQGKRMREFRRLRTDDEFKDYANKYSRYAKENPPSPPAAASDGGGYAATPAPEPKDPPRSGVGLGGYTPAPPPPPPAPGAAATPPATPAPPTTPPPVSQPPATPPPAAPVIPPPPGDGSGAPPTT